MQAPYLRDIHAMFDPIPILRVHQFSHEVLGSTGCAPWAPKCTPPASRRIA